MNELTLKDAIQGLEELSTGDWVPYEYSPEEAKLILNHINNLQSKIDKAIEWIEQYEKQIGTLGETSKSIVLTDDVVIGNLLDILREDK